MGTSPFLGWALLVGGVGMVVAGLALQFWPLAPLGAIVFLVGTARLGLFPRPRVRTVEQQAQVNRYATVINIGAPVVVVAAALMTRGNVWMTTALFSAVLAIDIAYYLWASRIGDPLPPNDALTG